MTRLQSQRATKRLAIWALTAILILSLSGSNTVYNVEAATSSSIGKLDDSRIFEYVASSDLGNLKKTFDALTTPDITKVINTRGPEGQTPLMMATLRGEKDIAEYLLSIGADINIGEKDGFTPIHGAGFQGRAEIAKLLIAKGANPSEKHADGYAAFHRACWGREKRHTETVKAFLEAGVELKLLADNGLGCNEMSKNRGTLKLLQKQDQKKKPTQQEEDL